MPGKTLKDNCRIKCSYFAGLTKKFGRLLWYATECSLTSYCHHVTRPISHIFDDLYELMHTCNILLLHFIQTYKTKSRIRLNGSMNFDDASTNGSRFQKLSWVDFYL